MSEVLTGAETKKALECCTKFHHDCSKCPSYIGKGTVGCVDRVKKGAFYLINRYEARITELEGKVVIQRGLIDRQKAEIERYLHSIKLLEKDVAEAKAEAVKGFAEIVKANLDDFYYTGEDGLVETGELIDILVNIWLQETKKEGTEK